MSSAPSARDTQATTPPTGSTPPSAPADTAPDAHARAPGLRVGSVTLRWPSFMRDPHAGSRFSVLEGYRAIAASVVVVHHVSQYLVYTGGTSFRARILFGLGQYGVAVFLLLSGFLLFRPFVLSYFEDRPHRDLVVYFRRRALRILPLYWFVLTVSLLWNPTTNASATPSFNLGSYTNMYLLLTNFHKELGYKGLIVAWTLHLEVAFYISLPILAWLLRNVIGRGARTLHHKLYATLGMLGGMYLLSLLFRWFFVLKNSGDSTTDHWYFNFLDLFVLGMLLATAVSWRDTGGGLPRPLELLARSTTVGWALAIPLFIAASYIQAAPYTPETDSTFMMLFGRFFLGGLASFLLLLPVTVGTNTRDPLRRAINSAPMAYLGMISYGIYLWHLVILRNLVTTNWWLNKHVPQKSNFWLLFALVYGVTLVLASATYYGLERPLMQFRDPKSRRVRREQAELAGAPLPEFGNPTDPDDPDDAENVRVEEAHARGHEATPAPSGTGPGAADREVGPADPADPAGEDDGDGDGDGEETVVVPRFM